MNNMTIEEKAKRYDEAIKLAKDSYNYPSYPGFIRADVVFPELKESKDERIRNQIINFIEEYGNPIHCEWQKDWIAWLEKQGERQTPQNNERAWLYLVADVLTWSEGIGQYLDNPNVKELAKKLQKEYGQKLYIEEQGNTMDINPSEFDLRLNKLLKQFETLPKEELASSLSFYLNVVQNDGTYKADEKQGEQKPADKVEPKFHKGEWVVWQDKCYKVNYNGCGYELIDQNGLSTSLVYGTIEENAHLWTIKDAKDGDVLCSCQIIVLFKKWEDNTDYNFMIAYAGIDVSNKLQITNKHWLLSNDCKPATKEQRDLLFQKMREAGYEWDAEKLELKKIEQKPTEWSEEDERMYKSIIYSFDHNYPLLIQQQEFIKSLIFQKQWKPTKAQLTSLTIACDRNDRVGFDLTQLLKELKKL